MGWSIWTWTGTKACCLHGKSACVDMIQPKGLNSLDCGHHHHSGSESFRGSQNKQILGFLESFGFGVSRKGIISTSRGNTISPKERSPLQIRRHYSQPQVSHQYEQKVDITVCSSWPGNNLACQKPRSQQNYMSYPQFYLRNFQVDLGLNKAIGFKL